MKASHFSPDIWAFIKLLGHHEVEYVIVGGEAVIHYGYARLTGDVDVFYGQSEENAKRMYQVLVEFWDGDVPGIESAAELGVPDQVIQFGRPPNRLDLLTTITGVSFRDAWRTRTTLSADDGTSVHMISQDLLIANKEASGRPKDLADAAFLRASGA